MSKFNERLNLLKEEENLSAIDMAKKIGISPSTLAYYFKDREPKYDVLMKIASEFNVTTDWLTGYSDVRSPSKPQLSSLRDMKISDEDDDENKEYFPGDELQADVSEKALELLYNTYPDDKEALDKEVPHFKNLEDDFFPNSDSVFGSSFDDSRLMFMINNVFSKYVSCIIKYSTEASLIGGIFYEDDILEVMEVLTIITETLTELMTNYNYHIAKAIAADKSPNSVQMFFEQLSEFNLEQYHRLHPEFQTIATYNHLFNKDFTL